MLCQIVQKVAEKYVRVVQAMCKAIGIVGKGAVSVTDGFKVISSENLVVCLYCIKKKLTYEFRQESDLIMMFVDDVVICCNSRVKVEENLEKLGFAPERRRMKESATQSCLLKVLLPGRQRGIKEDLREDTLM